MDSLRRNRPAACLLIARLLIARLLIAGSASGLFWLSWLPIADGAEPGADPASAGAVWQVDLDGPVGPAAVDLIIRSMADAAAVGAQALIIRMDTPGGLDKSMRELVQAILAAEIPVITYVAPGGARAASAGTYITFASHIAAMAPATNIGSSTPVSLGPGPTPPTPGSPAPGNSGSGEQPDGSASAGSAPTDAMTRKIVNDAVAYLQGLAELRGRNVAWAEATVRQGANLRASEALAENVIDLISEDLAALLTAIDGRVVALTPATGSRAVTLRTRGAVVHQVESDWKHDLLELITDPTIAYGLLIFGVYGLILEFYNPGLIFPSVIGVVCLLLGAYGLQMLPVNYAGLALILVGIGMMLGEAFTPTMGALGITGVIAFVLGSLMLLDTQSPEFGLPVAVIAAFSASTAALTLLFVGLAVKARNSDIRTGREVMLGKVIELPDGLAGEGHVHAFGELWQARATLPIRAGGRARIIDVDGLMLIIAPADEDRTLSNSNSNSNSD